MKLDLINKKTGEIGYLIVGRGSDHYVVTNNLWDSCGKYDTLAELNEEWEDYEEPKDSIEYIGLKWEDYDHTTVEIQYQTEEEAEKAVEKLKAWKRLKDKGIRFFGYDRYCDGHWHIDFTFDNYCTGEPHSASDDLDLLFSQEDD